MTQTEFPALPKVGPICYAAAQDVLLYKESPAVGRHIPGVFDVALWSTDQMRAYGEARAAAEREAWGDALSDALQSDLENGVKWLNERAAAEFLTKYPALSAAIRARGET